MTDIRPIPFRGGVVDGRRLKAVVDGNRHWVIPTVDGLWVDDWRMDRAPRPDLLDGEGSGHEHYWRVGDGDDAEFVHSSLWDELPAESRPPTSVLRQARPGLETC